MDIHRNIVAIPFTTISEARKITGFGCSTLTNYRKSGKLFSNCCYIVELPADSNLCLNHVMPKFNIKL